jgi:hypothetical protein
MGPVQIDTLRSLSESESMQFLAIVYQELAEEVGPVCSCLSGLLILVSEF